MLPLSERVFHRNAGRRDDFLGRRVPVRVDAGGVKRLLPAVDTREANGLAVEVAAHPRHFLELFARGEVPLLVAMLDDPFRQPVGYAGKTAEQFLGSGVEIDADLADTRFDRSPKFATKLAGLDFAVELTNPQ